MTQTAGGTVVVERDGAVAVVRLTYPERRNALSLPLRAALTEAMAELMADDAVRVVVLTGDGAHFCSGGDISSFEGVTPASGRVRMQRVHNLLRLIMRGEKPVIAAVEGHAAGAGLCLAAACDIVVAARDAQFSCTFNRIGLLPDFGAVWTLPLRMGVGRAKLLAMSGRVLDGPAAEAQGLAEVVVEPGQALTEALTLAREIAGRTAPLSNALFKAILTRGPTGLEEMLAAEADAQGVLYGTEDFDEGWRAFMGKRKPDFKGR